MASTRYALKCINSILSTEPKLYFTVLVDGIMHGTVNRDVVWSIKQMGIKTELHTRRLGKATIVNRNWKSGYDNGKEYFLLVDGDIQFVMDGWLKAMISIVDDGHSLAFLYTGKHCERGSLINGRLHSDFAPGAVWLLPRRTLETFGFLYDKFGKYGHVDREYSARITAGGGSMAAPEITYSNHMDTDPNYQKGPIHLKYGQWKTKVRASHKDHADQRIASMLSGEIPAYYDGFS